MEKAPVKKSKTVKKGAKKKAEEVKEELPLYLKMKVDDMKAIKHNRLVFGEKDKDSKV